MNSVLVDSKGRTHEERRELRQKLEAANKEAFDNWHNDKWRREMAAEMTEVIYEGFEHENILSIMSEVENAGFNDRVFVKDVRGLRAHWVARGGYIEASTIRSDVMELPRDSIGFHVYEFEDKMMTNFSENQANLVDLGIQRMDAEVNNAFLRLLQAAVPDTSPFYIGGSGVPLSTLNTALREVRDESRSMEVVMVGRATVTDKIIDSIMGSDSNGSGYLPESNEALIRRGVLGTYRGATIITLKNYKDDTDTPFFPANELFVIARDASKFAFWGGLLSKEWTENENWYWHYLARRDFGGTIHRPERIRRIVDTSQTP